MSIDAILAAAAAGPQIEIPPGWGQGRATFGGLVAAVLLARLQALAPAERRLRSFSLSFVGPVAPGAVALQASILRSGKYVTQGECRLLQNGEVMAVMLASFGASRESVIHVVPAPAPAFKPGEVGTMLPYIPKVVPDFVQKIDISWTLGGLPYTGASEADIGGWVRFHDATREVTPAHIVALVDAWPPTVASLYKAPAPSSSMTWTLELMDVDLGTDGNAWWQYLAETDIAEGGYAHIAARLWRADGTLVAISRQTAVIFA
jgi:acyl-CoA thioesterase